MYIVHCLLSDYDVEISLSSLPLLMLIWYWFLFRSAFNSVRWQKASHVWSVGGGGGLFTTNTMIVNRHIPYLGALISNNNNSNILLLHVTRTSVSLDCLTCVAFRRAHNRIITHFCCHSIHTLHNAAHSMRAKQCQPQIRKINNFAFTEFDHCVCVCILYAFHIFAISAWMPLLVSLRRW